MKKLFARLFAPVYSHQINLKNGQPIEMTSPAAFTIEDVASTLRPIKKSTRFQKVIPWILVALLTIGLGFSLYFNWQQDQWADGYEDNLTYYQDAYESLRSDYDDLSYDYDQLRYSYQDLQDQNYSLLSGRDELLNKLYSVSESIASVSDDANSVHSDSYSLYSDLYYSNVHPTVDDLEGLSYDTDDVNDYLYSIKSDLEEFLYSFGQ